MSEGHVQLGEVNTWFAEYGDGDPLVMLHPGGADGRAFGPNVDTLATGLRVYSPDRRGHGRTADVAGPISFELMAQDTIAFLETVVGAPAHLVGYSDGAIVALHVALRRPDLVRRVVLAAGVFHLDGWLPGVIDSEEEPAPFFAENYGEVSPDGIEHFGVVLAKTNRMHAEEPTFTDVDLQGATVPVLVMVADDDEMALEHSIALYRSLPGAELAVVPGTSHGLLVEKPTLCNTIILDFLTQDPITPIAPRRRSPGTVDADGT
ncbi:MAG: alpha/beta fold hydrolase [Solirubrobacteraceae bacterium]